MMGIDQSYKNPLILNAKEIISEILAVSKFSLLRKLMTSCFQDR